MIEKVQWIPKSDGTKCAVRFDDALTVTQHGEIIGTKATIKQMADEIKQFAPPEVVGPNDVETIQRHAQLCIGVYFKYYHR